MGFIFLSLVSCVYSIPSLSLHTSVLLPLSYLLLFDCRFYPSYVSSDSATLLNSSLNPLPSTSSLHVFSPRLTRSHLSPATSIVPLEQLSLEQHNNTKPSTDPKRPTSTSHIANACYLHVPESLLEAISFKVWIFPLSL
jgi:hypothetical protein